jgi:hypothetical protein
MTAGNRARAACFLYCALAFAMVTEGIFVGSAGWTD